MHGLREASSAPRLARGVGLQRRQLGAQVCDDAILFLELLLEDHDHVPHGLLLRLEGHLCRPARGRR